MSDAPIERARTTYRKVFGHPMPGHVRETFSELMRTGKVVFSRVDNGFDGYTAIPLIIGINAAQRLRPYTLVSSNFYEWRAMLAIRNDTDILTKTKRRYLTIKLDTGRST